MTGKIPYKTDPDNMLKVYITPTLSTLRVIVCAANLLNDGQIILGVRHFCERMGEGYDKRGVSGLQTKEQGFVDQYGQFVTREDALAIVLGNDQKGLRSTREYLLKQNILFSEDLY